MNPKTIIILGHKGMLGQTAFRYFTQKGYTVKTLRKRFNPKNRPQYIKFIQENKQAAIINGIAILKDTGNNIDAMFYANTILPATINAVALPEQTFIHASTDGVFTGLSNNSFYHVTQRHNNFYENYGLSKSLAEMVLLNRKKSYIIRSSIIGLDRIKKRGLLEWFLQHKKSKTVYGFINHLWNGITTLEWCKIAEKIITNKLNDKIIQPASSEQYSKYQMLTIFRDVFETKHQIEAQNAPLAINRCLEPTLQCNSLQKQLIELKQFFSF